MITKYSDAYNVLFEKTNERLEKLGIKNDDGSKIEIQSLEEYFSHLRDLVYGDDTLSDKDMQDGYLFLKLPLDEPEFIIDANTRKIEIPGHFLANGLSVQGDEVAEIVFFEVDRFYDATDLSTQKISIQWETPKGVQGHTEAFIRDIESKADEDKLIFGWPITSDVTAVPGKLKFSVRFYTEDARYAEEGDTKGFSYVLSTLPATISINAGLSMDTMQTEADDATDLILGRLQNSPMGGLGDASVPVFVYWNPREKSLQLADIADVIDQIKDDEPVTLAAVATKGDSGTLYYGWYHDDEALTSETHDGWKVAIAEGYGDYLPVDEYIDGIATYFYIDENGERQKIVVYPEDFADEKAKYGDLYVNCSIYTLTSENVMAGKYWVNVKNVYYGTKAFATEVGKENMALLPKWTVNGPTKPEITINLNNELLAAMVDGVPTYNGELKVEAKADTVDDNTNYKWTVINAAGETRELDVVGNAYSPFNGRNYDEGTYQVTLSNFKNNKTVATASTACLVLNPIEEISMELEDINNTVINPHFFREPKDYEVWSYKWFNVNDLETVLSTDRAFTAPGAGTYELQCTIAKGSQVLVLKETKRIE